MTPARPTKEAEQKIVFKEMANIRQNFKAKKIDGYKRKKYVAKIMYMFMLGYEVDFGCIYFPSPATPCDGTCAA